MTAEEKFQEELRLILIMEYGIGEYHHLACKYLIEKIMTKMKEFGYHIDKSNPE